jgi:hypothetical protein
VSVDVDRSAVYAAEVAAFEGTDLDTVIGVSAVADLVGAVVGGDWWTGPRVSVVPARRGALSSSARCLHSLDPVQIRIAHPQANRVTAAHELAHALAGIDAGHGPTFRRAYLDVIGVLTNLDTTDRRHDVHVDQLTEAFAVARLAVGDRRWPAPTHPGGAIAL